MGRRPIIREAILEVLEQASKPLRFTEIRKEVATRLGRQTKKNHHKLENSKKKVYDRSIVENLRKLIKAGLAKKTICNGRLAYELTSSYYNMQNKSLIQSILESTDLDELYLHLEDETHPPFAAFVEDFGKLADPMRRKRIRYFCPDIINWSSPPRLIETRMMETYTDLPTEEQEGIVKLLTYAYWCEVKSMIANFGFEPLPEALVRCKNFATHCIEGAKERGDQKRVEAEKAIISILDITEELIAKDNLKDFLEFLQQKTFDVKRLQSELLSLTGQFMATGEKIYNKFLNFHDSVISGIMSANLIPRRRKRGFPFLGYRYLLSYGDVWDEFFGALINQFNSSEVLENINENFDEAVKKVRIYKRYLTTLATIPLRSKMYIVYLWGYPKIFELSDKDFLPMFEGWLKALETGNLDHRSWIFKKESVALAIKAYKAVRRGKEPPNEPLDIEQWTIRDLYLYHPRGKDVSFWKNLLVLLNKRLQLKPEKREISRHILSVLEKGY